jgi:hypothetical protein
MLGLSESGPSGQVINLEDETLLTALKQLVSVSKYLSTE